MTDRKAPDEDSQGKLREKFSVLSFAQKVAVGTATTVLSAAILAGLGFHAFSSEGRSATSTETSSLSTPSSTSTSTAPTFKPTGSTHPPDTSHTTGCVLTITFPYAKIRATPNLLQSGTNVPPGKYPALKSEVVSFAGSEIRWYEIPVEGQRGWIPDYGEEIASKSGCPVS
jgi:hypothetical protein